MKKVWLSTTYYMDEAVQGLSPNAERAMTRAIAFCGNAENGGRMRVAAFSMLGLPRPNALVDELLAARLLVQSDDPSYVEFRKWDEWQQDGNALVERQKKDAARQARRRKKLKEEADASRELSRDVTGTEERREEKIPTKVGKSSHVSTAGGSDSRRAPAGRFEDSITGPVFVESADPVLDIDVDSPRGPGVKPAAWSIVRDVVPIEHPQAVKTALAMEVGMLLKSGTPEADVRGALELWLSKSGLGPRTLPSLVSEVIRNRATPRPGAARPSTTDARVQAVQAAKLAERDTGRRNIFALGSAGPAEIAQ